MPIWDPAKRPYIRKRSYIRCNYNRNPVYLTPRVRYYIQFTSHTDLKTVPEMQFGDAMTWSGAKRYLRRETPLLLALQKIRRGAPCSCSKIRGARLCSPPGGECGPSLTLPGLGHSKSVTYSGCSCYY